MEPWILYDVLHRETAQIMQQSCTTIAAQANSDKPFYAISTSYSPHKIYRCTFKISIFTFRKHAGIAHSPPNRRRTGITE